MFICAFVDLTSNETANVTLPGDTQIQYKYIRRFLSKVTWESDPNRVLITPGSGKVILNDTWR